MTDFNLDGILSQILYVFSGFFFGIFASRYSVLAWRNLRNGGAVNLLLRLGVLALAFIVFPLLYSTRTPLGCFVYYAVLIFYFSKGRRL